MSNEEKRVARGPGVMVGCTEHTLLAICEISAEAAGGYYEAVRYVG